MSDQMHALPWHLSVYQFQEDGPMEFWLQDVAHLKVAQFEARTDAEFVLVRLPAADARHPVGAMIPRLALLVIVIGVVVGAAVWGVYLARRSS
jgi:hypothetical protein